MVVPRVVMSVVMSVIVLVVVCMVVFVVVSVVVLVVVTIIGSMTMSMIMAASMISIVTAKVVVSVARMQNLDLNQVESQADNSHDKHDPSDNLWWLKEPFCRFDHQPDCHDPHRGY